MKVNARLLFVALALSAPVWGLDTRNNPDKVFSVGFDYTRTNVDNALPRVEVFPSNGGQNTASYGISGDMTIHQYVLDARMPVSNTVTVTLHGGPYKQTAYYGTGSGYSMGGGVRYYFNGD